MSSIAAVTVEAYTALEKSTGAQRELDTAATLLGEACAWLLAAFEGSNDPEKAQLTGALHDQRQDCETLIGVLGTAERLVRTWIADEVGGAPAAAPPAVSARRPGSWRGHDAIGHARDAGRSIGRLPGGSKKHPVREVRTLRNLDELFTALARGAAHVEKPSYEGWLYRFPDGSTIGYRTKSASTVEPTIEITTAERHRLKIHVNPEGWA